MLLFWSFKNIGYIGIEIWHKIFFVIWLNMFIIDNILVDEEIGRAKFACNLDACNGACCTFEGDFGAPVLEEEVELIKESFGAAWEYLSDKSRKYIENHGFVEGEGDDLATVCIDNKDCVFVYYDGKKALCALERAYFDGKTKFRKPISCHLFPIRVGQFGGPMLYYEKISECKDAVARGKEENIALLECVKDALIRKYGEEWFDALIEYIKEDE